MRHATLGPARSACQRLQTQGSRAILHHLLPFSVQRWDISAVELLGVVRNTTQAVDTVSSYQEVRWLERGPLGAGNLGEDAQQDLVRDRCRAIHSHDAELYGRRGPSM
jgi:hypothetical protein